MIDKLVEMSLNTKTRFEEDIARLEQELYTKQADFQEFKNMFKSEIQPNLSPEYNYLNNSFGGSRRSTKRTNRKAKKTQKRRH